MTTTMEPYVSQEQEDFRKYRILIVDDEPNVRTVMQAILDTAAYISTQAASGEQAQELYRQGNERWEPFDLVLLDLTLPGGISGLETLDALRAYDPHVRVIAASGFFDEAAAGVARRRGFIGILPKPFTAERLIRIVNWGVGKAAA